MRAGNPLTRELTFYGGNAEAIRSRDPEVCLCGPAGTGKSLAWLYKLHRAAIKYPGMRGLIVRKTRESLSQSGLVTFEDKILPPEWRFKIATNCQRRVRQSYRYPNGSEIVVGGLDKPSKVMSTEFDLAYIQEAVECNETDWESLSSRLRNARMPYQQLGADTNPDAPTHWLKQRIDSGKTVGLESRHEDNPSVTVQYLARLDALTGVRYLRLRKGLWAGAEGMVYDEWDASLHIIDPISIPDDWKRIRVIDFGFTNPFVCQWWAIDGDGRMHLYRELYGTQRIVNDWAEDILRHSQGETIAETIVDHDAEDRATLMRAGIQTLPARKNVKGGIELVQQRLRKAGDGKPRIYLHRNARVNQTDSRLVEERKPTCTLQEVDGYTWAKATEGRAAKEEPVKINDHGLDAMRYAVAYVDGLGQYSAGAW
jgi:PBSX family phage terminase large subunit